MWSIIDSKHTPKSGMYISSTVKNIGITSLYLLLLFSFIIVPF